MNYLDIRYKEKSFISLTSVTVEMFDEIIPHFQVKLERLLSYTQRGTLRVNGCKYPKFLPRVEEFLFFTLTYLKNNPLQEYHSASYGMSQSVCSGHINTGLKSLNYALKKMGFNPCRTGSDLADFVSKYDKYKVSLDVEKEFVRDAKIDKENLFLGDTTIVGVGRSIDEDVQRDFYSGKHKKHGVKNTYLCNKNKEIIYLGKTTEGKVHDKKMLEQEDVKYPSNSYLFLDLAYETYDAENVEIIIPFKKPKGGELTEQQKIYNQIVASARIAIEHVIRGVKRCRILMEGIRFYLLDKRDMVIETCAALHNLRTFFSKRKKTTIL